VYECRHEPLVDAEHAVYVYIHTHSI
jgi:hypothetical protein